MFYCKDFSRSLAMGNCQNDLKTQNPHFKRKRIFHNPNQQNIPPPSSLPSNPCITPNSQNKPDLHQKDLIRQKNINHQNIQLPNFPQNSIVQVQVSRANPQQNWAQTQKLPYILSDQLMSLGEISNFHNKNQPIDIQQIIEGFQKENGLKNLNQTKIPNRGGLVDGDLPSNSWGRSTRKQIGIKYTNSVYLSDEQNYADQH